MRLLIVDDQLATLNGLTQGIDWQSAGFSDVVTAQNAMEARLRFAEGVPDMMLCDIEMPVETGLDLSTWVREQGYGTKIIFLTCHSDFAYAQEAITIGASDYIVQPAPYHLIREKVEKVMRKTAVEESYSKMAKLGKTYTEKHDEINSSFFRGFLRRTVDLNALAELPDFPDVGRKGLLILIQLVQDTEEMQKWDDPSLNFAVQNSLNDTFEADRYLSIVTGMGGHCYALLLQPAADNAGASKEDVIARLGYMESMFEMYMPCSFAFYVGEPEPLSEMPDRWDELLQLRNMNTTAKKGIYTEREQLKYAGEYKSQFYRWSVLLRNADKGELERDLLECLNKYVIAGELDSTVLAAFHREFTRLIFSAEDNGRVTEFFEGAKGHELLLSAMHSVSDMEKLIRSVVPLLEEERDEGSGIVKTIIDYIEDHLSENIRKEDLAELMFMNEDYLTRVFKRETGMSIKSYIIKRKMETARDLLQTTSLTVSSVAIRLGYSNFSHFAATYKKEFGVTPAEEKEKK